MTVIQKIALSIMVITFLFCGILGLAIKGCDIDGDNKYKSIYSKGFSYNIIGFVLSLIVFVLGFIW